MHSKTRTLARVAVFSALCVIGSFIPFPSPVGTIAFDSFPGFLASLAFSCWEGALVCFIGHLATSIIHGFPLGLLHIAIAFGMGLAGFLTGFIKEKAGVLPGCVCGVVVNVLLFPLATPVMGFSGALLLTPYLAVASSLNMFLAALIYGILKRVKLVGHNSFNGKN